MGAEPVSSYHELAPPPALAPYVTCLWVQRIRPGAPTYVQPVLPDACIDVVAVGGDVTVVGPATTGALVHLSPDAATVGVRFRTGAAPPILGTSAADLRDLEVPVDQLWGRAGASLTERVGDADGWQARLGALVDALLARLGDARPVDELTVACAAMVSARPDRPLAELAREVALSERQLRRRVEDAVGYPPHTLARIQRFQRFLRAARAAGPGRHLARVAAEAGYADQAHLTRESRRLSGLPPAALLDWEAERLSD